MLIDFFDHKNENFVYFYESDTNPVPISSNNCLALRRSSYGGYCAYPLDLDYGEDVYICTAYLKSQKRYLVNKNFQISHLPRKDFISLLKQFLYYGMFFTRGLKRAGFKGVELSYKRNIFGLPLSGKKIYKFNIPFSSLVMLTRFNLLVLGVFLYLLLPASLSNYALICFVPYLMDDLKLLNLGPEKFLKLFFTKLFVNFSLFIGAMKDSLRLFCFFVPPAIGICQHDQMNVYPSEYSELLQNSDSKKMTLLSGSLMIYEGTEEYFLFRKNQYFLGYKLIKKAKRKEDLFKY